MPEFREVYGIVTQRRPPLHDALAAQRVRQRRSLRNRKIGTFALSAAVVAAAILAVVLAGTDVADRGQHANEPADHAPASPEPGAYLFDIDTRQGTKIQGIESPGFLSPGIAVSGDGSMVAYGGNEPNGRPVIYVANADGTGIRPLGKTARDGIPVGPEFSPDGSKIVFQAKGPGNLAGDIFVVDVGTGATTRVTDLEPVYSSLWYLGPHFGPDGHTIFFTVPSETYTNEDFDLWSVPVSGGTPRLVLRGAVGGRISPDGRQIVYFKLDASADGTVGDMWLADVDGSDHRRVAGVRGDVFSARWSPDGTRVAYTDQASEGAYVVDLTTGEVTRVLDGVSDTFPEWVDDHTWIVGED